MRAFFWLTLALGLSGCLDIEPPARMPAVPGPISERQAVDFDAVRRRIEPMAEAICRQRAPQANCDFRIFVDARPGQPPNAYQTVDEQGRPEIGFTSALIANAYNNDELAFVLGHEAAHHIAGHLGKTRQTAVAGAVLGAVLAGLAGASAADIDLAQNIGGTVGARRFSKEFELEADRLGSVIAFRAGFDPLRGAQFFRRIPDPGDQFLGTHPPNAARIDTVRQTVAGLR